MNKVYPDAQAALHDVFDGAVILAGGFGLSGNPENCIARARAAQGQEPDDRLEQLRHDRQGPRCPARAGPGQEDGLARTSARTRSSSSSSCRASSRSSCARRARSPSGSAPAAPASRRSTRRPASARRSPRARRPARSTASTASSSTRSAATSRSSRRGRATAGATSCSARPRATSTRCARRPARSRSSRSRSSSTSATLDPDQVHLPSIYVQRIFQGTSYEKPIEQRTTRRRS